MSSMMGPQGPLSPRVYWTRRLLVVAVVLLVVVLVWWLVGGSGAGSAANEPRASRGATSPSSTGPTQPLATHQAHRRLQPSSTHRQAHRSNKKAVAKNRGTGLHQSSVTTTRVPPVLPQPTGSCQPDQVAMAIHVSDSVVGRPNTVTVDLTTTGIPACTLAVTPSSFTTQVTSGSSVVWSSADCPNTLPAKQIVVRPSPVASYQFTWDGQGSTSRCQKVRGTLNPGTYWVQAALIGGQASKARFAVKAG